MKETTLVIGGTRSGKSRHALTLAAQSEAQHRFFLATCMPHDEEMKERIARHQAERSKVWRTLEVPVKIPEMVSEYGVAGNLLLVDCLTLWINNLFLETDGADIIGDHLERLISSLEKTEGRIILVTNEVGTGIVPENRLAREFRDVAGFVNQKIAQLADGVIMMVAGIPITIKRKG